MKLTVNQLRRIIREVVEEVAEADSEDAGVTPEEFDAIVSEAADPKDVADIPPEVLSAMKDRNSRDRSASKIAANYMSDQLNLTLGALVGALAITAEDPNYFSSPEGDALLKAAEAEATKGLKAAHAAMDLAAEMDLAAQEKMRAKALAAAQEYDARIDAAVAVFKGDGKLAILLQDLSRMRAALEGSRHKPRGKRPYTAKQVSDKSKEITAYVGRRLADLGIDEDPIDVRKRYERPWSRRAPTYR